MWGQRPRPSVERSSTPHRGRRRSRLCKSTVAQPAPQMERARAISSSVSERCEAIDTNFRMPRSMAHEQDILQRPAPKRPPRLTSRRIGIHTSTAGGVQNAAERAYRLGCNTLQIFSSSPRQWAPYELRRATMCRDESAACAIRLEAAGHSHQLPGEPRQLNELFLQNRSRPFAAKSCARLSLCADYLVCIQAHFVAPTASRDCCAPPLPLLPRRRGLDLAAGRTHDL